MNVKIIKNDSDYDEALRALSELIETPYDPNSDIENTIEMLMLVIKDYEQKVVEPFETDPIEAIKFRMEQMNFTQKHLIEYIGSASKVSEVLNGKRSLSLTMIRKLHKGLGIPLSTLIGVKGEPTEKFTLEEIDYSCFPLTEMKNRGYFNLPVEFLKHYKDYSEEIIRNFCGIHNPILTETLAYLRAPLHLRGKKLIDKYALAIWKICVLKKASKLELKTYNSSLINEAWLRKLIEISVHEQGPKLAQEYLQNYGIALIIEPHFKKTFLDGAAMMFNGHPIIGLTLRHDRLDNFWFVLAHELAHVMKHLNPNEAGTYFDDLDDEENLDEIEMEADAIANEALIPTQLWKSLKISSVTSTEQIITLSKKINVSPAIIAGRLRHERQNYAIFRKLIDKKILL